jgi:peroxiredoxin/predicted 2-oxoglutarate/Fe(II)-dependent dioxygenase YbiX
MIQTTSTISLGSHAPRFGLTDTEGEPLILKDIAGKPLVLFFHGKDDSPAGQEALLAFRDRMSDFQALDTRVVSITMDAPASRKTVAETHQLPFPMLSDEVAATAREYGICKVEGETNLALVRTIFLLDRNQRIVGIYPYGEIQETLSEILEDIKTKIPHPTPQIIPIQAPVLLIPNVLEPHFCKQLMDIWETQGNTDSGFMKRDGESTIGVYDYSHKIRKDHFIRDADLIKRLDNRMHNRVFPEILKAFNYDVTRREDYKIACYESNRGGYFRPHRDNTSGGTAHRRWAMSLNLNTDEYEGGHLRFPEYGPHLYHPGVGDAVIFSCRLLHEATDITAGNRFVLLSFFYGEVEAQGRQAYEAQYGDDYLVREGQVATFSGMEK